MKLLAFAVFSYFVSASTAFAQGLVIPQIADGGGWQTTLVLTNTGSSAATGVLSFYMDTTNGATASWSPGFLENIAPQAVNLPAGSSLFLHTPGTAGSTSTGWGLVNAGPSVSAYAIFTQREPGRQDQDGTANAVTTTGRILVPFDNTPGFVTTVALVNTAASSQTISAAFRTSAGTVTQSSLTVPAQGHLAFTLPQQFSGLSGQSGLAEFYSSSGAFALIALRFNPTGAFTAAPAYAETGPPVITPAPGSSPGTGGVGGNPVSNLHGISAMGTFAADNQTSFRVVISVTTPVSGGFSYGSVIGSATSGNIRSFDPIWNNITVSGQTLTFSGLQTQLAIVMTDGMGNSGAITDGSVTLTLSPQTNLAGTFAGTMTIASSLATLTGPITGTYLVAP